MGETSKMKISSLIAWCATGLILVACGKSIERNIKSPTLLDPSLWSTQVDDDFGNSLPEFGLQPGGTGSGGGNTTPTTLPFDYDPAFLNGENPISYLNRILPPATTQESRNIVAVGDYRMTILARPTSSESVRYEIVLGAGVQFIVNANCPDNRIGEYRGPISVCVKFTAPNLVPTAIQIRLSTLSGSSTAQRTLRVLVLPRGPAPQLALNGAIVPVRKSRSVGLTTVAHRIPETTTPGEFRIKATYDGGRELADVQVVPNAPATKEGTDWVIRPTAPGTYTVNGNIVMQGAPAVPATQKVGVGMELRVQAGENDNDGIASTEKGVVTCINGAQQAEVIDIVSDEEDRGIVTNKLNIAPGASASTPEINRKSGDGATRYVFFTIKGDSDFGSVNCSVKVDTATFSLQ